MKKVISLLLVAGLLICALCGCGKSSQKDGKKAKRSDTKADDPAAYTYIVKPLQGVSSCIYYGSDDEVPNSPDPEAARNKIHVWAACPICGDDGFAEDNIIDVKDLDFSNGETIQYSDSSSCYNCYRDRNIPNFMWSISITREKIK